MTLIHKLFFFFYTHNSQANFVIFSLYWLACCGFFVQQIKKNFQKSFPWLIDKFHNFFLWWADDFCILQRCQLLIKVTSNQSSEVILHKKWGGNWLFTRSFDEIHTFAIIWCNLHFLSYLLTKFALFLWSFDEIYIFYANLWRNSCFFHYLLIKVMPFLRSFD